MQRNKKKNALTSVHRIFHSVFAVVFPRCVDIRTLYLMEIFNKQHMHNVCSM